MPTPAITKVVDALAAQIAGTGYTIIKNRSRDDEIEPIERPAINIRVVEQTFEPFEFATSTRHTCSIDLDLWTDDDAADTVTDLHAEMAAKVMEAIAADRTLGGPMQSFEERSLTTDMDSVPELGVAVFTFEASFLTPRGDFYTILGATGPIP